MENAICRRQTGLILYKHHKVNFTFLAIIAVLFTSCSVSPILESPRVRSGVKIETAVKHSTSELKWNLSDSIMRNSEYSKELKFGFGDEYFELAPLVKFAIANRVELGGYFWWFILNMGWDGRIKVALFEKGEPHIFRNVAGAVIIGSNGYNGEWENCSRNWAGISLGTYHQFRNLGIEYVLMPTAGKSTYRNVDDPLGSGEVSFYDITLVTGINADISKKVFSSIALTTMKKFTSHCDIYNHDYDSINIERISFSQAPIGFNFIIGYRFGSHKD